MDTGFIIAAICIFALSFTFKAAKKTVDLMFKIIAFVFLLAFVLIKYGFI